MTDKTFKRRHFIIFISGGLTVILFWHCSIKLLIILRLMNFVHYAMLIPMLMQRLNCLFTTATARGFP